MKKTLAIGIIFLFLFSSLAPMSIGITVKQSNKEMVKSTITTDGGLMDSPWPMVSHDLYHTGRSDISTAGNPGAEIWRT